MDVTNMGNLIVYEAAKFPLKYLGVPVGCNMARCFNWKAIIRKFSSKLSLWKARLISVGGHLTLIMLVLGNLLTYYMSLYMMSVHVQQKLESIRNNFFIRAGQGEKKISWVKWKKCLASKKLGGLVIGSIYGLNIGLMFKWIWRLLSHPFDLWAHVIKTIHGPHGGILDDYAHCSSPSPWGSIRSRNGDSISFWEDIWCGDQPLKLLFLRIFSLDIDRDCLVANWISLLDWFSVFRRASSGGDELSQFEALQAVIEDVVLTD
ncbi:hypothetical protein Tco_1258447 [Tanacetum coccineum]